MKRTFSLLFAMVLILSVFPVSSAMAGQEDCQHFINQSKTYKEYRVLDAYSHQVETWSAFYCYYCNVFFRDMGETLVASEEQWHSFNSKGKCTQCGYQKTGSSSSCSHSSTKEVAGTKTYDIILGNDRQHRVIANYSKVCTKCNKTISTEEKNQVAAHTFSGNTCTVCGYTKASTATTSPSATATPKPTATPQREDVEYTEGDWTYMLYANGDVEITGYTGDEAHLTIPSNFSGHDVTNIGTKAFEDCDFLQSVIIPNGVNEIGVWAFVDCEALTDVTIPDSVTRICCGAFEDCTSLVSIEIPNGVNCIETWAFASCASLTSVTIPNSVKEIQDGVFSECNKLNVISLLEDNPYYTVAGGMLINKTNQRLIACTLLEKRKSIVIPEGISSIGDYTFKGCSNVTRVVIPNGVTSIGECAFRNCKSLTSIILPSSLTSINYCAFAYCKSLSSITLPQSVTFIGDSAFMNCDSLTSVSIPTNVTSIGAEAFCSCDSLTSVTLSDNVAEIGAGVFAACKKLVQIELSPLNPYYIVSDGMLIENRNKRLVAYPLGNAASDLAIPEGISIIGESVFYACDNLTSVALPSTVTSIEDDAFEYCHSLTKVIIPASVISIDEFAFYDCENLVISCAPSSYADQYAKENDIQVIYDLGGINGKQQIVAVTDRQGVVDYLIDDDKSTAWSKQSGYGADLTLYMDSASVGEIWIRNGYAYTQNWYNHYDRADNIRITVFYSIDKNTQTGETYQTYLMDSYQPDTVSESWNNGYQRVQLPKLYTNVTKIELTIDSAIAGYGNTGATISDIIVAAGN